jgi:mRNA-degrading endonuclease toxin of MazEF toxin-antitoxin module
MCAKNETIDTIQATKGMVFFMDLGSDNDNKGGTLIKKIRPCMVYASNENYNYLNPQRYTVIPISSREDNVIFNITDVIFIYKNEYKAAVVDSMTCVSVHDVKNYMYTVSPAVLERIEKAVKVHLGHESADILDVTFDDVIEYSKYREDKKIEKYSDDSSNIEIKAHTNPVVEEKKEEVATNITPVTNITTHQKSTVSPRQLTHADLLSLKKRTIKDWTTEECLLFMDCFNLGTNKGKGEFNNSEVARIFGIKLSRLYNIKYQVNKRLNSEKIKRSGEEMSSMVNY